MKHVEKITHLGAVRWFRTALAELPNETSPRAACLKMQEEEIAYYRRMIDRHQRKPEGGLH